MPNLNLVQIIGNLGQDPEMKYTPNGDAVTNFSVAVNETWKNKAGEKQSRTEWFNVVCWRQLAELCSQYLSKGRPVYLSGKLQTRSWDGTDGVKHYRTELVADRVQFLGDGGGQRSEQAGGDIEPDDLPF